ncbi:MAG: hypothetical protein KatS3mg107_0583 [Gemmataceae bacterium]|nr:MAG: hypothetical protein KatS3mg107_0583 [Gemmataceae bacterium]
MNSLRLSSLTLRTTSPSPSLSVPRSLPGNSTASSYSASRTCGPYPVRSSRRSHRVPDDHILPTSQMDRGTARIKVKMSKKMRRSGGSPHEMKPQPTPPPWGHPETLACRRLVELALAEDIGPAGDRTSLALIDPEVEATAAFVARRAGVVAGTTCCRTCLPSRRSQIDFVPSRGGRNALAARNDFGHPQRPSSARF